LLTQRHKEHKEKQIIEGVWPIAVRVTSSTYMLKIFVFFVFFVFFVSLCENCSF